MKSKILLAVAALAMVAAAPAADAAKAKSKHVGHHKGHTIKGWKKCKAPFKYLKGGKCLDARDKKSSPLGDRPADGHGNAVAMWWHGLDFVKDFERRWPNFRSSHLLPLDPPAAADRRRIEFPKNFQSPGLDALIVDYR